MVDARDIRHRFPMAQERQAAPRFDGRYEDADVELSAAFAASGSVTFADEGGTWLVEAGELSIQTASWSCSGAIGVTEVYLLAVKVAGGARFGLEMGFRPTAS